MTRRIFDLLALDLDGTLLRSDGVVSPRNAEAIQRAVRAGARVVFATARAPRSVDTILDGLRLLSDGTLTINYNGALIWDPSRGEPVAHRPLPASVGREMLLRARAVDPDVILWVEILNKWYSDRHDLSFTVQGARPEGPHVLKPIDRFWHLDMTKLMLLAEPPRLRILHVVFDREFVQPGQCACHVSDDHILQFVSPGTDKGNALREICARLDVPRARVLAIGDAPNDASMLRFAGLGLAVGGCWEELHAVADEVLQQTNDEDAVAVAIERFVLNPEC